MASNYKRFFHHKHYSYSELYYQFVQLKKQYKNAGYSNKQGGIDGFVVLQPTEYSISYKLRISAKVDSTVVSIYPVDPLIERRMNGTIVPHMYPDGSLCLFYPKNNEWDYSDLWTETLIPWASLWLYYYEIWIQTGEWLGKGIHPEGKKKKQ